MLLGACSDERAGTLPPPASPTTAAPTTPSPTASVDYEAEARRAVDTYFSALNAALRDPAKRTDELAALIDPSCTCRQVLEALREEGRVGRYLDYRYTVSDVRVQQAGSLGASMTYTAHQTAGHQRDRHGRIVRSFPANTTRYSAHFRRDRDAWRLDRLDQVR